MNLLFIITKNRFNVVDALTLAICAELAILGMFGWWAFTLSAGIVTSLLLEKVAEKLSLNRSKYD